MEDYLVYLINNFSPLVFFMGLGIFLATMLVKIPIKKATHNFVESKRQGINSLIIVIPLLLSFVCNLIYFLIAKRDVLSLDYVSITLSTAVTSIALYVVYSRIVIIAKGVFSGKIKKEDVVTYAEKQVETVKQNLIEPVNNPTSEELIKRNIDALSKLKAQISMFGKEENQGKTEN